MSKVTSKQEARYLFQRFVQVTILLEAPPLLRLRIFGTNKRCQFRKTHYKQDNRSKSISGQTVNEENLRHTDNFKSWREKTDLSTRNQNSMLKKEARHKDILLQLKSHIEEQ